MVIAVDVQESSVRPSGPPATRAEVIARYRQLRAISKRHQDGSLKLVSSSAMLQQARRLGMSDGRRIFLDQLSGGSFELHCDLLVYAAPAGRSRAVDRYARNSSPPAGSDEALVLDAMRNARFGVLVMQRRHPVAGLILTDIFRNEEIWLVDEGLETCLEEGMGYAMRYCTPEQFSMTTGAGVPVSRRSLHDAILAFAPPLARKPMSQAVDDPRFAEAVYRAAVMDGRANNVIYRDPPAEGYAA
jgi:hypothetical protein